VENDLEIFKKKLTGSGRNRKARWLDNIRISVEGVSQQPKQQLMIEWFCKNLDCTLFHGLSTYLGIVSGVRRWPISSGRVPKADRQSRFVLGVCRRSTGPASTRSSTEADGRQRIRPQILRRIPYNLERRRPRSSRSSTGQSRISPAHKYRSPSSITMVPRLAN
jgi:hypothetical protein